MAPEAILNTIVDPVIEKPEFVPQADSISIETVVNMLVKKGVCTVDELFILEGQVRENQSPTQEEEYYRTKHRSRSNSHKTRMGWLKKFFVKFRWTRRLGTKLFGWKWKKIKRSPETVPAPLGE